MRWIAPILFLGIVFNSLCLLVFRIKLDRRSAKDFQLLSNDLQSRISSFSDSALRSIDLYFVSNYHARVSSDISVVGASRVPSSEYFAEDCGEWDYHYSRIDGFSCAMVGTQVFRVGDPFPRGGRISSIYPDSIVVNGEYFFAIVPIAEFLLLLSFRLILFVRMFLNMNLQRRLINMSNELIGCANDMAVCLGYTCGTFFGYLLSR